MRHLFENNTIIATTASTPLQSYGTTTTTRSSTLSKLDDDFDDDFEEQVDELDRYISEKPANRDMDVLSWWNAHQTQFPRLASMARDYLAIPATSVPSERLFSAGKNMIQDNRSRLVPKTIRMVQCLRSWMEGPLKRPSGEGNLFSHFNT
jgi:hypothetical protein